MPGPDRPRVLVTRRLPGDALERLARAADVDLWPEPSPPPRAVLEVRLAACEGIVALLTDPLDAAMMDRAPRLRVISNCATGVDNIDLAAAAARGIRVGHTPGVLTETTADLAFALLLAAARRVVEADAVVRDGRWKTWDPSLLLGQDVHGATLSVVGFGAIGRAVARRAAGFAMEVLYVRRDGAPVADAPGCSVGLEEALRRADFVSLHVPLTASTHHLIGARELAWMKPTAVLINTARGGVLDPRALVAALASGHLAAAALDVAEEEPIPAGDPLLAAPRLLLAPHIGSASVRTRARMADLAIDNCLAGLAGLPLPHEKRAAP